MGAKRSGDGGGLISEADLFKLLRVSEDAVLIGGQAVAFWVAYFRLPIPPGPRTYVSHEADFLGFSRLKTDAVRKKAVQISDPKDPSFKFKVMHPIDCMVSRFENLRTLSEKRNEIGVWQARISIDVCRAYIEVLIAAGDEREAIRAATGVLEAAGATPGLQAFRKYGLDLLDGIPTERFTSISFKTQQYARTAARIRMLREAFQSPAK